MRDHTSLRAFVLVDALALDIYRCTRGFPAEERYGLTSQLRRGAVSIASNIVEGSARSSQSEYVRFLEIAYGAAREVQYQLSLAHRLDYIGTADQARLRALATETGKVLGGLVRSMRRD